MTIHYRIGDVTEPVGTGRRLIAHICNDVGAFGAGVALSIAKRYPQAKRAFQQARAKLGEVVFVESATTDVAIANMIAQHDIRPSQQGRPPIRYGALAACLDKVGDWAVGARASVHMPRIGTGLAGGDWGIIEPLIELYLGSRVYTVVYTLRASASCSLPADP